MKRYLSLDFLRGFSIFGMVFSAIIPAGLLPAWMYHIQNPPPTHQFDMTISGISWVDLVFPVFIFCMGVAIPLAGNKNANTVGKYGYIRRVFERFVMLWLFSYLYLFLNFSGYSGALAQLMTIAGFALLFSIYYIYPSGVSTLLKRRIRTTGVLLIVALIAFGHYNYDKVISLNSSGIIIFLLAFLYLFGSLIWFFTRDNLKKRGVIFALILLFTIITIQFDLQPKLYAIKEIRWFFNMEYIYFLLILLPATFVGDRLHKKTGEKSSFSPAVSVSLLMFGYLLWLMVAFYKEFYFVNLLVTLPLLAFIHYLVIKFSPEYNRESFVALIFAIAGSLSAVIEGSITKAPCTLSYCLMMTPAGIYLLVISDKIVSLIRGSYAVRIFAGSGSNPLMSYIAFGSLVMPFFKLTGLVYVYRMAYPEGHPWIGTVRAALVVLLTMALVAKMSEKKIFWRA